MLFSVNLKQLIKKGSFETEKTRVFLGGIPTTEAWLAFPPTYKMEIFATIVIG